LDLRPPYFLQYLPPRLSVRRRPPLLRGLGEYSRLISFARMVSCTARSTADWKRSACEPFAATFALKVFKGFGGRYTLLSRFNINYIQYAENICRPKLCPPPSRRIRFVTHISICHSFLVPQERRLYHVRMDCLMAMGWRLGRVGAGIVWVVGCGWQSAG
jgi:hypothetical protein